MKVPKPRVFPSPVRQRCLNLLQALKECGHANEIPLESAKIIFSQRLGLFDKATIKAYFGTQPHRSIRRIQKLGRYSTGTISFKSIELAQDIPCKKGYLEILGLATLQKKGQVWFLRLNEVSVVAELGSHTCEKSEEPIEHFSLSSTEPSPNYEAEGVGDHTLKENDRESPLTIESKQTHTLQGEREKSTGAIQRAASK